MFSIRSSSLLLATVCLGLLASCYPINEKPLYTYDNIDQRVSRSIDREGHSLPKDERESAKVKMRNSTRSYRDKEVKVRNKVNSKLRGVQKSAIGEAVIKYASLVPGKKGFVFNPFTQNQVDVRGIPSGTKVRDPYDSNPKHLFLVP